jgi:hypothetical protein
MENIVHVKKKYFSFKIFPKKCNIDVKNAVFVADSESVEKSRQKFK